MPQFNLKTYYGNLARTFRQGPTVPHRIANKTAGPGEYVGAPIGTAAAYLAHSTNSFTNYMSNYGNASRLSRYSDYQSMESMAEIASGLDIYAHEAASKGEFGEILRVESDNPKIKDTLIKLFYDTLNLEFNAVPWIRTTCKYGDNMLLIDHHPDYGVVNLFPMPVNEVEREEGFDPQDPTRFQYRWETHGRKVIEPWQVLHFRLLGNDSYLPYGMSVLEPCRRPWRQLLLLEDAVMVYRIVRSPERRVFYIDVGNIAPNDVPNIMEKAKNQMKRNQIVDPTSGQLDIRYNALSCEEDFFLPVRGQETGTRIETLPGGQYTGDIDDLHYIQNKLFAALKIPKSYLGYEDASGKASLSQEDVRFARTISHIQKVFLAELEKVAMVHLYTMGLRDEELLNFKLSMANPSTINEIQRLELWRTRFEVASLATGQDGILDKQFIYQHIFHMNPDEINKIEAGRLRDQEFQAKLESIQPEVPEDDQQGEPEETDEPPVDADTQEDEDTNPLNRGRDPNVQRAIPNDMLLKAKKSKIKTPSTVAQVYNTSKNDMDPERELQLLRRLGTAPFGESKSVFEKQVGQLGRHTEFIKSLGKIDMSQKKKNIL